MKKKRRVTQFDLNQNLNSKESLHHKNICNKILKNLSVELKLELLNLFGNSIESCKIPENWRKSIITMISKCGDKPNTKFYRQISTTGCILCLFEKLVSKHEY